MQLTHEEGRTQTHEEGRTQITLDLHAGTEALLLRLQHAISVLPLAESINRCIESVRPSQLKHISAV